MASDQQAPSIGRASGDCAPEKHSPLAPREEFAKREPPRQHPLASGEKPIERKPPRRRPLAPPGAHTFRRSPGRRLLDGGIVGNERLTAATGILLILLFAALGVTILRIGPLISVHLFLGLLLIPPVLLKLASTGYRFMRYYTGNRVYRERGAPPTPLRLLAPVVVFFTVAVFATGVALLLVGPSSTGPLRMLHKASFIAWVAVTALHLVAHLPDVSNALLIRRGGRVEYNPYASGRTGRTISLAGALLAGLVLALLLIPSFEAWTQPGALHRHDHHIAIVRN